MALKAPFPWFGGKRRVASQVWDALGDVPHYVEPFAGSLAVLLERPAEHVGRVETVNDKDCLLANFWRALAKDPDEVARWASDPVNEADLHAKHLWIVEHMDDLALRIQADPDVCDPKIAGWWVWGICAWIGSKWCSGTGPWHRGEDGRLAKMSRKKGDAGVGIHRQRPHLGNPGQGIHRQRPHLGNPGREERIRAYLSSLAARLEDVRVCCGDWSRVVTNGATSYPHGGLVGVFLDPPYLGSLRDRRLYRTDDFEIADAAREWAIAKGDDPRYRIVLAGYEPEHAGKIPDTWSIEDWSARGGYASSGKSRGQSNRHLERLWYSPHCLWPGED